MTANMNAAFAQQVRIDQLSSAYQQLGLALIDAGTTPAQSVELLEKNVSMRCCQCGITITGKELSLAAASEFPCQTDTPKVGRLIAGYCGRKGCSSYHCELRFETEPGIDWPMIWESARSKSGAVELTAMEFEPETDDPPPRSARACFLQEHRLALAILSLVAVLALIGFLFWSFLVPAYSRNPSGYKAAPASTFGE